MCGELLSALFSKPGADPQAEDRFRLLVIYMFRQKKAILGVLESAWTAPDSPAPTPSSMHQGFRADHLPATVAAKEQSKPYVCDTVTVSRNIPHPRTPSGLQATEAALSAEADFAIERLLAVHQVSVHFLSDADQSCRLLLGSSCQAADAREEWCANYCRSPRSCTHDRRAT